MCVCEIAVLSLLLLSLTKHYSLVVEGLALRVQAVGAGNAAVVNCGHGFVALVAGQLNLVILNNILLHNRVTALAVLEFGLTTGVLVEVAARDVPVVARDVGGHLGGAHCQVVNVVRLIN